MKPEDLEALRKKPEVGEWILWLTWEDDVMSMVCGQVDTSWIGRGSKQPMCCFPDGYGAFHLTWGHRNPRRAWCRPGDPALAELVKVGGRVKLHTAIGTGHGWKDGLRTVRGLVDENGWLDLGYGAKHFSAAGNHDYWAFPAEYECLQKREAPGEKHDELTVEDCTTGDEVASGPGLEETRDVETAPGLYYDPINPLTPWKTSDFYSPTGAEGLEMDLKQKLIGTPSKDIPHAAYMIAGRQLVRRIMGLAVGMYTNVMNKPGGWFSRFLAKRRARRLAEGARFFMESDIGKALISFGLAAGVQAFPIKGFEDQRMKLAYMLRVEAYSVVGDKLIDAVVAPLQAELVSAFKQASALESEGEGAEVVSIEAAIK